MDDYSKPVKQLNDKRDILMQRREEGVLVRMTVEKVSRESDIGS